MTAALTRSTNISGRALAVLGALAVAFGAAFVLAPRTLAASRPGGGFADQQAIVHTLRGAFVQYWNSGSRRLPPDLANLVGYWSDYLAVKAVCAALLLVVLVAIGTPLGRAVLGAGEQRAGRRVALLLAWLLVAALALVSALLVVATVQGTFAPFTSVLTMLPLAQLTPVVDQIREQLTGHVTNPALAVMISDDGWYHLIVAVLTPLVALVLTGMSVVAWRRFAKAASADRWRRRMLGSFGILCALVALAVFVVAAANASTAADPAPALLGFFNGEF